MKKIFSLLLVCMLLFLTACNQAPQGETTGNLQNQEQTKDTERKETIVQNGSNEFIVLPSRILFDHSVTSGQLPTKYVFYYSKADGKAYVYCFDPLCDHSMGKCLGQPIDLAQYGFLKMDDILFINNRFYGATTSGNIVSFAFDGSDVKMEYTGYEPISNIRPWSSNFTAYGPYIYIRMVADESGNPHTLRFNTETKEMEDLTEKTGNYIDPYFFYNGEIYGSDSNLLWIKTDLDLKEKTSIEAPMYSSRFYGSVFFANATDSETKQSIGLHAYDMKTGELKLITHEMLGLEANPYVIVAVDENYVYFYQSKKIFVGQRESHWGLKNVYKSSDGKLYRVKHDGTECVCIYDNPEFDFDSLEAVVFENKMIIRGYYVANRNGFAEFWDSQIKIGAMGEDGKIEKFENIELVY